MATSKKQTNSESTVLDPAQARTREGLYRDGVDISVYELAEKFEADGYDWRQALKDCGYSDEEISDVDKISNESPMTVDGTTVEGTEAASGTATHSQP